MSVKVTTNASSTVQVRVGQQNAIKVVSSSLSSSGNLANINDIDDKIIARPILKKGDASFTLYGGHTYEILEDNTLVYEYKTGPYEGQKLDKEFI